MRSAPAHALLFGAALLSHFGGGAALAQDARSWVIISGNTEFAGEQVPNGSGCRFTVTRGETKRWSADRCFGERTDARFLSADGQRVLVLYTFPETGKGMAAARAGTLFDRGEVVKQFRVGQFVKRYQPLIKARKHFYWLEGALGQTGVPPGLTKDGRGVELNTLDGRRYVIGFDGSLQGPPAPKRKQAKRRRK